MLSFQSCLWQGSAHTGPALTPVEVLVAIHGIIPEKDGLALKKACLQSFYITTHTMSRFPPSLHLRAKVYKLILSKKARYFFLIAGY